MAFATCVETCNTMNPLANPWTDSCGLGVAHLLPRLLTQEQEQIAPSNAETSLVMQSGASSSAISGPALAEQAIVGHRALKQRAK